MPNATCSRCGEVLRETRHARSIPHMGELNPWEYWCHGCELTEARIRYAALEDKLSDALETMANMIRNAQEKRDG